MITSKKSKHAIESGYVPLKWSTASMIEFGMYIFKDLNAGKITSKKYFINSYVE